MKATRILFVSGIALLLAVFIVGIYVVPKLQSGSPATARQSDASRVSLSDVFVDATYATPDFVKRVKLEPYLQKWEGRAQPFLICINTHVGTIADLDLRGKVLIEDSHGDRYPSLGTPVVLSEHHNMYLLVFPLVDNSGQSIFSAARGHFRLLVDGVGKTPERRRNAPHRGPDAAGDRESGAGDGEAGRADRCRRDTRRRSQCGALDAEVLTLRGLQISATALFNFHEIVWGWNVGWGREGHSAH